VGEDIPKSYKLNISEHVGQTGYETDRRKIVKLEVINRTGFKFLGLFVKCDARKLITARPVFANHYCSPSVVDVFVVTAEGTCRSRLNVFMIPAI
jgi:hypothetical protein